MQRSVYIDELRILAVFLVIISHTIYALADRGVSGGIIYYLSHTIGPFGVSIFIIISGYLAAAGLRKDSAWTFYRKKVASLLPPIWVAFVFVGFALFFFEVATSLSTPSRFQTLITSHGDPFSILSPLIYTTLGIDGYIEASKLTVQTYFTVGEWFTGFIIVLFVFTPAINALVRKSASLTLAALFAISFLSFCYPQNGGIWNWIFISDSNNVNPTTRLFEFGFGMYLYQTKGKYSNIKIFTSLIFISYMALIYLLNNENLMASGFTSYLFTCCFIVIFTERLSSRISVSIKNIVIELSKLSFMAMIVHHQIVFFFVRNIPVDQMNTVGYIALFIVEAFLSFYIAYLLRPISRGVSNLILSTIRVERQVPAA